jgi:hypothetical protein
VSDRRTGAHVNRNEASPFVDETTAPVPDTLG